MARFSLKTKGKYASSGVIFYYRYTLFFCKNSVFFLRASIVLNFHLVIIKFLPSYPFKDCFKLHPWCKLSFETVKYIPIRIFVEINKILGPYLSLDVLIKKACNRILFKYHIERKASSNQLSLDQSIVNFSIHIFFARKLLFGTKNICAFKVS